MASFECIYNHTILLEPIHRALLSKVRIGVYLASVPVHGDGLHDGAAPEQLGEVVTPGLQPPHYPPVITIVT